MVNRPARIRLIGPIRDMTREDMAATLKTPYTHTITADRIRDSHHRVARLVAAGFRQSEIADKTGFSSASIARHLRAPAMQQLIATYRAKVDAKFEASIDQYYDTRLRVRNKAIRQAEEILDAAEETNQPLPVRDLLALAADTDDRIGYNKREARVNLNADFAEQLEKAIARSGKVIEVESDNGKLRRRA